MISLSYFKNKESNKPKDGCFRMKVLLFNPNALRGSDPAYPLGLSLVAAAAKNAGHWVQGIDLFSVNFHEETIFSALEVFKPDVVGVSVRNIDDQCMRTPIFFLEATKTLLQTIRARFNGPIIVGGAGYSIFPKEALGYLQADYGIQGEGERPFVMLLEALEAKEANFSFPGLARITEGRVVWFPNTSSASLEGLWPDRELFSPLSYLGAGAGQFPVNMQTRRGCPLECIYCTNPWVEGKTMKFRNPEDVAKEVRSLSESYGIEQVTFVDSLFNHPSPYTESILNAFFESHLKLAWECTYNPRFHDPLLLSKMRDAGCVRVSIGNESGSSSSLRALKKGFGLKHIERSILDSKRLGLETVCFLLIGAPGETKDSVLESVQFLDALNPSRVVVTIGIRLYPGLELAAIAAKEGMIGPGQNLLYPTFYLPREIDGWAESFFMEEVLPSHSNWTM